MKSRFALATTIVALGQGSALADTTINFFGDINYNVEKREVTTNSFQAATLDMFATQREGKFSFIGEVVIEAFGENEFGIDVDRLEVTYQARPWLRLSAGRIRSAFGYYGDAYQNGKFFMTPVSWPEMYEGDGFDGILPSHAIGLHADATYELGNQNGKLRVDAEVLNGRGIALDVIPAFKDSNNAKAYNLRLRYVGQDALDGLTVGGNVYLDEIPENAVAGEERPAMHELILAAHAAYVTNDVHLIGEVAWLRHREIGSDAQHTTLATFAEAGYAVSDFMPYVRYEYTQYSDVDPYFAASGLESENHQLITTGVKYTASASVAMKVQGGLDIDSTRTDYLATAQAAFAF